MFRKTGLDSCSNVDAFFCACLTFGNASPMLLPQSRSPRGHKYLKLRMSRFLYTKILSEFLPVHVTQSLLNSTLFKKEFVNPLKGNLNADAWLLKAAALECDKMYDQASNAFQTALKIQPTSEEGRGLFLFM